MDVAVTINGTLYERDVDPRKLLIHFLRDDLDLTGSHIGCDTGNCGACSVIFDGTLVKSCMLLAVQANGAEVETVEGLAEDRRLTQGDGVFVDDVKRHGMGYLHFVRSPYAHANIVSVDVSQAEALGGVYGTLTGEEVASLTDPFFQIAGAPGGNIQDFALAV